MKSKLFLTGKIISTVVTILLAILLAANPILTYNEAQISAALGAKDQVVLEDESEEVPDTQYYKTDFNSVAELKANAKRLAQQVSAEGMALLKNDNGALPLAKGKKIGFYSVSSVDHIVSGGGSSQASVADTVTFKKAFIEEGFALNEDLYSWYEVNKGTYGRTSNSGTSGGKTFDIEDAPWDKLPESKNAQTDLAIFVLSRMGGESTDLFMTRAHAGEGVDTQMGKLYQEDNLDVKNGNYLELNDNEISVLAGLKAQKDAGKIGKIMVLMNFANQVELDFIDKAEYGIDAALWVGTTGSVGTRAVADVVSGDVNPSGGLMDTFWTEHHYNPVYANWTDSWFGYQYTGKPSNITDFPYPGAAIITMHTGSSEPTLPYVVYEEGVYNGYKYTETRYEDVVMKTQNVGSFDYSAAVKYPFGFGLSYSTFTKEVVGTPAYDAETDTYTVKVKVSNTGTVAGKDTVEIYVQKPYTAYDKAMGVEKPAVELVGYGKTDVLAAGASETLEIKVDRYYFASYDSYGARGYIIEEGDYYLIAASDAHEAVNNVLAYKGYTTADGMTANGNADMVMAIDLKTLDNANGDGVDAQSYKFSKITGKQVTNQFDNADPLYYMANEQGVDVKYLTRNDWAGTVEFGLTPDHKEMRTNGSGQPTHAVLPWTDTVHDDLWDANVNPVIDDVAYPTMGSTKTSYTLVNLMGKDYDDEMWDDLLDQMSWNDMVRLLTDGERKTQAVSSIAKPQTIDHNGAIGVNQTFAANAGVNRGYAVQKNDPDRFQQQIAYPCNGIVAATFNDELVYEYGQQWGEDALWAGYSGIYGPGANGHRSAYAGRNFEYYSEDGILGGEICARVSKGLVEHGILVYLKHAILNDQENNRLQLSTYGNEQTIREVYLRPFELAIVKGGAQNVMSGYNCIGAKYTGVQGFCNTVLRNEFGMTGFVVTDYLVGKHEYRMPGNILHGNDLPDRNWWGNRKIIDQYDGSNGNYGEFAWAMRKACHNILYGVANSAAMNGLSNNTRIITFTPTWKYVFNGITNSMWWLLVSALALCAISFAYEELKKKNVLCSVVGDDKDSNGNGSSASGGAPEKQPEKSEQKVSKVGVKATGAKTNGKKKTLLDWIYMGTAIAVAGVLVIGQSATLITLLGQIKDNNAIIALEKVPEEAKVIDPNDVVSEGTTTYKFEAETAKYEGVTGWSGEYENKLASQSYVIGKYFSGNILLWNINQGNARKSNKLTFNFTSDKAETIIMKVSVSGLATDAKFSAHATLRVNGELYNCEDIVKSSNSVHSGKPFGAHEDFLLSLTVVCIPIEIKEGENEITFSTRLGGANTMFGFDYIELLSTANIEYQEEGYWDVKTTFSDPAIPSLKVPTANETGKVKLYETDADGNQIAYSCYELPALSEGTEIGMYKIKDDVAKNEFVYYLFHEGGTVVDTVNKGPFTVTFQSPYVTVNASGNSITDITTTAIGDRITVNCPDKRKVAGWYNVNNRSQYWDGGDFKVPEGNVTVAPIFDGEQYTLYNKDLGYAHTIDEVRSGKVNQAPADFDNGECYLPVACTGTVDPGSIQWQSKNSIMFFDDGTAEYCYQYNGPAMATGNRYAVRIPCFWNMGTKVLTTTFKNVGNSTLHFEYFIFTASTNCTGSKIARSEVNITPGEVATVVMTTSGHNSMMYAFQMLSDSSDFHLQVMQYVDASNNLTLQNATYADGSIVKRMEINAPLTMADVNVSLTSTQHIAYWYNVADETQRWAADLSDFKMGGKAMTISPKIEDPATQHTLTLSGAKFADNSTSRVVDSGTAIPSDIVITPVSDMIHVGWVDVATMKFYSNEAFAMERKDMTIAPVFDRVAAGTSGYNVTYFNPATTQYDDGAKLTTSTYFYQDTSRHNSGMVLTDSVGVIRNQDGNFERSVRLVCSSQIKTIATSALNSISSSANLDASSYDFCFSRWGTNTYPKATINMSWTNYGDETVSFRIYWSTASSQWIVGNYKDVTIQAGETVYFTWNGPARDSFMMGMVFTSENGTATYDGCDLGFIAYNS